MTRHYPGRAAAAGFTLLELSVVLIILTLLLGSILYPLTTQVQQRKVADAQHMLEETRQALIGYAMINGRLPQPAKSQTDGAEQDDPAKLCTTAQPNFCTGFVPWAALGTARADPWGKLILYSVNPNYAGNGTGAFISAAQFSSVAGQRIVNTRGATACDVALATNLPAVILSLGARNLGTTEAGVVLPDSSGANPDEDMNATAGASTFCSRPPSDRTSSTEGEFDDIVVWIAPAQLFTQLVAAGRLP
jgi:prepilin-type N-terminal cleavage/methylation domain-containing protein